MPDLTRVHQRLNGVPADSMTDDAPNTAAARPEGFFLQTAQNLADVPNDVAARANLGLGAAALRNLKTTTPDVGPSADPEHAVLFKNLGNAAYSTVADILALIPSSTTTFIGLTDTPDNYVDGRPVKSTTTGVVYSTGMSDTATNVKLDVNNFFTGINGAQDWGAIISNGVIGQFTGPNIPVLDVRNQGVGYSSQAFLIRANAASSAAFDFARMTSNIDYTNYGSGDPKFIFRGDGNAFADGAWGSPAADLAEYHETIDGQSIDPGHSVVLVAGTRKVRRANSEDDPRHIIGVVRPKNGAVALAMNGAETGWAGKWLRDPFGGVVEAPREYVRWSDLIAPQGESPATHEYPVNAIPPGVTVPGYATRFFVVEMVKSPEHDPSRQYIPRSQRPEWVLVGKVGQIEVRDGEVIGDRWISCGVKQPGVNWYEVR